MKFIVSSTLLSKHLQSVSGVLNTNNTLPILDNFLFQVSGKKLHISASDLETTMTTELALEKADADIAVAIPAKLLLDALKTFPEQPLSFSIDAQTFGIELSTDTGKYKLAGMDGVEFPKVPSIEAAASLEMDAATLFLAINRTLFATGNDDLRPIMTGVLFEFGPDGATFVATDAHKLVKYKRKDVSLENNTSFIMPKKPLNLLKNLAANAEFPIKVSFNDTNAHFTIDNTSLICRLIDGKFPNYEAVIPKDNPHLLSMEKASFLNSVRRVSIFSNKTTHQVRLKIAGSELQVSAEDLDFSNEAIERLTCNYKGDDMEIGFNSRFLLEMLNHLDSSEFKMELSAPNRAGILLPNEEDLDGNEELLMLVMPVMLAN